MANWDERFIQLAKHISTWSKDLSTKVGVVIADQNNRILSVGYNGLPTGADDTVAYRYARPQKYKYTEHAERNAIYSAARNGINIEGATMYLMWFPCPDCARAIIQAGISRLVCMDYKKDDRYSDDFDISKELLTECEIRIDYYYE